MIKRALFSALGGLFISFVTAVTAQASGFFGVLIEQTDSVILSAPTTTLEVGATTQASASGGNGDGRFTFATSTSSKCSISASGLIMAISAGNCSVTATKVASGLYLEKTSAALTVVISAPEEEEAGTPGGANSSLIAAAGPTYQVDFNLSTGLSSEFSWSGSERVLVTVESNAGKRESEFQATKDKSGIGFVEGLIPGYKHKITVRDFAGTWEKQAEIAVPPTKITGVSATPATAATNYTYILKWRPQSYLEYYKIVVTNPSGEQLIYYSKNPDWALNNKAPGRYLFEILAQGEGEALSEPVRFVATVTNPINISSKLPTNPATNRLTTTTSNQLKSIANRLTAQTVVTVTTYYDPKVKGAKKLATTRIARAAATLKVTKSTLEVRTQVRPTTSKKSLTQIILTTKAPARKLTLTNA